MKDVDWDGEALAGENGVHDWNVLVREVGGGRGGEEKDAGLETGDAVRVGGLVCCSGGGAHEGVVVGDRDAVDVAEGESEGAGDLGGCGGVERGGGGGC